MRIGIAAESFKLCVGHEIFRNDGGVYACKTHHGVAAVGLTDGFQLVLEADERALLSVNTQPAFHRAGMFPVYRLAVTGPLPVSLSHIGLVDGDDALRYGDILLTAPVVELEAKTPTAVYAEVSVPEGTPAGVYAGSVTLYRSLGFSAEEVVETLMFQTTVYDVAFPSPRERRFHLDLWLHPSNIARKAEAPLWSERHFAVLEPYLRSLAELGQRAITVIASEIPWSGQAGFMEHRCNTDLYEYGMIAVSRREDGSLQADFSVLDRYLHLCYASGFRADSEIEVFGLINIWCFDEYGYGSPADYCEAIRVRVCEADGRYAYLTKAEELDWYIQAIEQYFAQKDLLPYVRVAADEPADLERFRRSLEHIKALAPGFRYKAAINHAEFIEAFAGDIHDFVPIYTCLVSENAALRQLRDSMPHNRFLWYVCCVPAFPNTFIGSSLLEGRALGLLTLFEGLHGFLRWNYTVWNADPRRDLRYPRFACGDMNFVYPAGDMTPLLSLRYQALKRGLEDYELLQLLNDRGETALVQQLLKTVVKGNGIADAPNTVEALLSLNAEDYDALRRRALMALSGEEAEGGTV